MKQPETKFKEKVLKKLRELDGLWCVKTQFVSIAGIPDIIGCYNGRFFAWELKTDKGRATKLQQYILKQIGKAGGITAVVSPKTFEKDLKNLRKKAAF